MCQQSAHATTANSLEPAHESLRLSPCRRRLEDKRSGFQKTYEKTSPQTRSRYYDAARRCLHLLNARVQFRCRFRNPVHRSGSPFRYSFTLPNASHDHLDSLRRVPSGTDANRYSSFHPTRRTNSFGGRFLAPYTTGTSFTNTSLSRTVFALTHLDLRFSIHSYLRLSAHLFRSTS